MNKIANFNSGWVKLHRQLLHNPIMRKPKYLALWVYLLLIANHEPHDFIWNNERITVKRGQIVTGRNSLAENTGIAPSTIEDILRYFEKDGQIRQQKNNKFRLITVKNYNQFQKTRHLADNKPTHIKNEKNEKKYNKEVKSNSQVIHKKRKKQKSNVRRDEGFTSIEGIFENIYNPPKQ